MRKRDVPEYWENLLTEHGVSAAGVNTNERTHRRRLAKARELIGDAKQVLDVGGGVGLLDIWYGPFGRYTLLDFCEPYLERYMGIGQTSWRDTCHSDARKAAKAARKFGPYDCAVVVGVTTVPGLWNSARDVVKLIVDLVDEIHGDVIVGFAWSGWPDYPDDVVTYSTDEIMALLREYDLMGELHFGYLPHEFMVKVRKDRLP